MAEQLEAIAEDLYNARRDQVTIDFVRTRIAEDDKDSAYAISELVTQKREAEGARRVGRKVGLTNPVVQQRAGVDEPDYGVIMDDMVFESPVTRPRSKYIHPKIEAELAFVLKNDVRDDSLDTLTAAIDYVVPALELVDNRYPDYRMKIVDTIADNAACEGIVVGSERQEYGETDLRDVEMVLYKDDQELTRGKGKAVMENPLNAIHWLAKTANRIGRPLLAGEILLSGSIGIIVDWEPGATYTARYSHGFGEVSATLEGDS